MLKINVTKSKIWDFYYHVSVLEPLNINAPVRVILGKQKMVVLHENLVKKYRLSTYPKSSRIGHKKAQNEPQKSEKTKKKTFQVKFDRSTCAHMEKMPGHNPTID